MHLDIQMPLTDPLDGGDGLAPRPVKERNLLPRPRPKGGDRVTRLLTSQSKRTGAKFGAE